MPVNECIPVFEAGAELTGRCTAAVRGKRFVSVSADITGGMFGTENPRIKECAGATEAPIGVARYDGVLNQEIPFINIEGLVVPMPAGAAITAGELVMSDSQGRPVPFVGPVATGGSPLPDFPIVAGIAVTTQTVVGNDVAIRLKI